MQRDNSGSLISAFINTVSEFKDHVTKEINALDGKLQNAQDAINSRVESEVYGLKCEIDTLKQKLTNMEQLMEQRASLDLTTSDYPQAFEDQNPFRNEKIPRNIMPPACRKGMSLQFRWEHFEYLCKTVLQRLKKPYKPEYLMTFKKNSPKYAAGLRDNIRSIHGLDSSATWSDLTDKIRREAEVLFEKLVDDEFPLRTCVENWGAKLIMRKAFLKHDKAEEQTVDKNAVADCTVEATENVDGMSDAESINMTSEHDDNLLEEYDMLFTDEEPMRFDEEPAGFSDETLMLDTKLSSDEDEDCMEEQKTNIEEKYLQNQIDPNVYGNKHKQPSTIQAQRSSSAVQKKTIYKQTEQVQDPKPDTRKETFARKRRLMEKDDETDEDNESDLNDGDALQGNSVMKKKRVGRPKKTANTKTPDEDEPPFPIKNDLDDQRKKYV